MPIAHAPDGASLNYEVNCVGPAVVLVHGITESLRSWDPLVEDLATDHHVISIDLRGHGHSSRTPPYDPFTMAADIQPVCEHAEVTEPLLVGHSLGGVVVTTHAAMFPVRGVVNVDQPLELTGFHAMAKAMEPMLRDPQSFHATMHQVMDALAGPLPKDERARIESHGSAEQDVVLGVWDMVLNSTPEELEIPMRAALANIKVPYLTILGNEVEGYESWLKALVPAATVETWPGDGHFPHLVEPERFLQRLRTFA
jgi:pimeloyl-ACP methyl ester carboxylesterase